MFMGTTASEKESFVPGRELFWIIDFPSHRAISGKQNLSVSRLLWQQKKSRIKYNVSVLCSKIEQ